MDDVTEKELQHDGKTRSLGPLATGCVFVNAVMGMGFLTLPYAFQQAGIFASAVTMFAMWALAVITSRWIIDAMAHANAIKDKYPDFNVAHEGTALSAGDAQLRLRQASVEEQRAAAERDVFHVETTITPPQMVELFFGSGARLVVNLSIQLTAFVTMVGYSALIASSIASIVDVPAGSACNVYDSAECMPRYRAMLLFFALVGTFLVALDVKEQINFQVIMTGCRLGVVCVMIGTCLHMYFTGSTPSETPSIFETNFAALPEVVALGAFALSFNFLLPELSRDLADKPRFLLTTVDSAVTFCGWTYIVIGVVVPLVFGSKTLPLCTLNFSESSSIPRWLSTLLVLMPVLDVVASYPLYGHCVASNLHHLLKEGLGRNAPPLGIVRLIIGPLAILIAWFEYDISHAAALIGIGIAFNAFILPALLWQKATSEGERLFTPNELASNLYSAKFGPVVSILCGGGTFLIFVFAGWAVFNTSHYEADADEQAASLLSFPRLLFAGIGVSK